MKKFIEKKWFPSVAVIGAVLVIALILFLCGFRITYAPDLENSWDAISAVASWIGAIGTLAAVWFAILLSDKQNILSIQQQKQNTGLNLYDKRMELFKSFYNQQYFDIRLDAKILFSDAVYNKIDKLSELQSQIEEYDELKKLYIQRLEEDKPELYREFETLSYELGLLGSKKDLQEQLFALCDGFRPIVFNEVLDYRDLSQKSDSLFAQCVNLHKNTFDKIQNEIKQSIL